MLVDQWHAVDVAGAFRVDWRRLAERGAFDRAAFWIRAELAESPSRGMERDAALDEINTLMRQLRAVRKHETPPVRKTTFGSTIRTPRLAAPSSPAPAYNPQPVARRKPSAIISSSTPRLASIELASADTPGPGAYDTPSSIAASSSSRRAPSSRSPATAGEERFARSFYREDDTPGPTAYHPERQGADSRAKGVRIARSGREPGTSAPDSPGPGAYTPRTTAHGSSVAYRRPQRPHSRAQHVRSTFGGTSPRFPTDARDLANVHLGPGSYNPSAPVDARRVRMR